ncbi:MAG: hypothetical protein ACOZCO_11580 [Bacteroidota bacterium]
MKNGIGNSWKNYIIFFGLSVFFACDKPNDNSKGQVRKIINVYEFKSKYDTKNVLKDLLLYNDNKLSSYYLEKNDRLNDSLLRYIKRNGSYFKFNDSLGKSIFETKASYFNSQKIKEKHETNGRILFSDLIFNSDSSIVAVYIKLHTLYSENNQIKSYDENQVQMFKNENGKWEIMAFSER